MRKDYTESWIHVCRLDVKFVEGDIVHYADVEFIARRYLPELDAYICEVVTTDEHDGRFAAVSRDLFVEIAG